VISNKRAHLRTVSVFDKPVQLGDRESHRRNQASQLTVSAIDNERTGVINNKRKTLT
jgi:hypothetical protein